MTDQPNDWSPEVAELAHRKAVAAEMGGPENIERQHAGGKLTIRERIALLLDPGSFQELGSIAGRTIVENGQVVGFTPANFVMGTGEIEARPVVVGGEDFTVRGGAADGGGGEKSRFVERLAEEMTIPLVRLIDGTGGSVRTLEAIGRTYVPGSGGWGAMATLMAKVPVVSAVVGSVAGLPAAKAAAAHWTIMVKDSSQLFVAGPPVVRRGLGEEITKQELGGYQLHARLSGVVDNVAEDEADCMRQIRRFLSYLPANVWQQAPRLHPTDDPERRDEELLSIIPRNRRRPYDPRKLIRHVVDRDSFFEISPGYGKSVVAGLARFDGYTVGLMASNPFHIGGSMDAAASEKVMRFVDFCDTFHLPIVNFVDQPGFMVGKAAEAQGTLRAGVRAIFAIEQSTVPWLPIIVHKAYGVAGGAHGRRAGSGLRYAWPSGEWGSLPIEGGVAAAFRREIEAAPDPQARMEEIEERLNRLRSPFLTAEAFGIEEIIDPRETRPLICRWVNTVQGQLATRLGVRSVIGMRP